MIIEADAVAEVEFAHAFTSPGAHAGWVDVDAGDALPSDNRRYFTVDVLDRARVWAESRALDSPWAESNPAKEQ